MASGDSTRKQAGRCAAGRTSGVAYRENPSLNSLNTGDDIVNRDQRVNGCNDERVVLKSSRGEDRVMDRFDARPNNLRPGIQSTQIKNRNQECEQEKLLVDVRHRNQYQPEAQSSQDCSPNDRNCVIVKQRSTPATFPVCRTMTAKDTATSVRQHLTFSDTEEMEFDSNMNNRRPTNRNGRPTLAFKQTNGGVTAPSDQSPPRPNSGVSRASVVSLDGSTDEQSYPDSSQIVGRLMQIRDYIKQSTGMMAKMRQLDSSSDEVVRHQNDLANLVRKLKEQESRYLSLLQGVLSSRSGNSLSESSSVVGIISDGRDQGHSAEDKREAPASRKRMKHATAEENARPNLKDDEHWEGQDGRMSTASDDLSLVGAAAVANAAVVPTKQNNAVDDQCRDLRRRLIIQQQQLKEATLLKQRHEQLQSLRNESNRRSSAASSEKGPRLSSLNSGAAVGGGGVAASSTSSQRSEDERDSKGAGGGATGGGNSMSDELRDLTQRLSFLKNICNNSDWAADQTATEDDEDEVAEEDEDGVASSEQQSIMSVERQQLQQKLIDLRDKKRRMDHLLIELQQLKPLDVRAPQQQQQLLNNESFRAVSMSSGTISANAAPSSAVVARTNHIAADPITGGQRVALRANQTAHDAEGVLSLLDTRKKLKKLQVVYAKLDELKEMVELYENSETRSSVDGGAVGGAERGACGASAPDSDTVGGMDEDEEDGSSMPIYSDYDEPSTMRRNNIRDLSKDANKYSGNRSLMMENKLGAQQRGNITNMANNQLLKSNSSTGADLNRPITNGEVMPASGRLANHSSVAAIRIEQRHTNTATGHYDNDDHEEDDCDDDEDDYRWTENNEVHEKLQELRCAQEKLQRLQELVVLIQNAPDGETAARLLSSHAGSTIEDVQNGARDDNDNCSLSRRLAAPQEGSAGKDKVAAGRSPLAASRSPRSKNIDQEQYRDKEDEDEEELMHVREIRRQQAELDELKEERRKLLAMQDELRRQQESLSSSRPPHSPTTLTSRANDAGSLPLRSPVGVDRVHATQDNDTVVKPTKYTGTTTTLNRSRDAAAAAAAAQVTFQDPIETVVSNEELYGRMRQQRMLREELREKKKELEDMMRKDHHVKQTSRNTQDAQSDNVSYSNKSSMGGGGGGGGGGASVSEDITVATWGGSTAGNLESIEENEDRTADDDDDDDNNDDDSDSNDEDGDDGYPADGIQQAEEEEEEEDIGADSDNAGDGTYNVDDENGGRVIRPIISGASGSQHARPTTNRRTLLRRAMEPRGTVGASFLDNKESSYMDWSTGGRRTGRGRASTNTRSVVQGVGRTSTSETNEEVTVLRTEFSQLQQQMKSLVSTVKKSVKSDRRSATTSNNSEAAATQQQLQQNQLLLNLNQCYFQLLSNQNALVERFNRVEHLVLATAAARGTALVSQRPAESLVVEPPSGCNSSAVKSSLQCLSDLRGVASGNANSWFSAGQGGFGTGLTQPSWYNPAGQSVEIETIRANDLCEGGQHSFVGANETSPCLTMKTSLHDAIKTRSSASATCGSTSPCGNGISHRTRNSSSSTVSSVPGSCMTPRASIAEGNSTVAMGVNGSRERGDRINDIKDDGVDSEASCDPVTTFDSLRETIYSEVATLISQNEHCPSYLVDLFRELQLLSTDYLRQRALYSIQDLIAHFDSDHTAVASGDASVMRGIMTMSGRPSWMSVPPPPPRHPPPPIRHNGAPPPGGELDSTDMTPSPSVPTSDDETNVKFGASASSPSRYRPAKEDMTKRTNVSRDSNFDYEELADETGSTQSTPSDGGPSRWERPFEQDSLGDTVIHMDKALRKMREYEHELLQAQSNLRFTSPNSTPRAGGPAATKHTPASSGCQRHEDAACGGGDSTLRCDQVSDGSVSDATCPRLDLDEIDREIKGIMTMIIPVVVAQKQNICTNHFLLDIQRLILSMTRRPPSNEAIGGMGKSTTDRTQHKFAQFFEKQLVASLQKSLVKFEGRPLWECAESLLGELNQILLNELAFFSVMQDLDDSKVKVNVCASNKKTAGSSAMGVKSSSSKTRRVLPPSGYLRESSTSSSSSTFEEEEEDEDMSDVDGMDRTARADNEPKQSIQAKRDDGNGRKGAGGEKSDAAEKGTRTTDDDDNDNDDDDIGTESTQDFVDVEREEVSCDYDSDLKESSDVNNSSSAACPGINGTGSPVTTGKLSNVNIHLAPSETKPFTRIGSDEDEEDEDESASGDEPSETAVSRDAEKERQSTHSDSDSSDSKAVELPEMHDQGTPEDQKAACVGNDGAMASAVESLPQDGSILKSVVNGGAVEMLVVGDTEPQNLDKSAAAAAEHQ